MTSNSAIQTRLQLIKSGFKTFVSSIRIPLSNETKWTLEIVCLNQTPKSLETKKDEPLPVQARFYLEDYLWKMQTEINKNKQSWITAMRNS